MSHIRIIACIHFLPFLFLCICSRGIKSETGLHIWFLLLGRNGIRNIFKENHFIYRIQVQGIAGIEATAQISAVYIQNFDFLPKCASLHTYKTADALQCILLFCKSFSELATIVVPTLLISVNIVLQQKFCCCMHETDFCSLWY